jgi:hypothetical protein
MALAIHLGHHHAAISHQGLPVPAERPGASPGSGGRVFAVQRRGAVSVGLLLLAFGLCALTRGVPVLSSHGERVLGLSADGLLAGLSVAVAVLLIGAAARGPRVASTVMVVLGALFLLSGVVNLFVLGTRENVLAFDTTNVVFSVVVGLLLLMLGAYGRFSGHLPADSPYAHPHPWVEEPPELPGTPEELAAEAAMRGRRDRRRRAPRHRGPTTAGRGDGPGAHPLRAAPRLEHVRRIGPSRPESAGRVVAAGGVPEDCGHE